MFRPKMIKYSVQGTLTIVAGNLTGSYVIPQAVVLANSLVKWGGWQANSLGAFNIQNGILNFTDTTHVGGSLTVAAPYNLTIKFTVVEYYSGILRNVQRGTLNIPNGATSNTVVLTRNTNFGYGLEHLGANNDFNDEIAITLAGTTLTASCTQAVPGASGANVGYQYYEM